MLCHRVVLACGTTVWCITKYAQDDLFVMRSVLHLDENSIFSGIHANAVKSYIKIAAKNLVYEWISVLSTLVNM